MGKVDNEILAKAFPMEDESMRNPEAGTLRERRKEKDAEGLSFISKVETEKSVLVVER